MTRGESNIGNGIPLFVHPVLRKSMPPPQYPEDVGYPAMYDSSERPVVLEIR